MLKLLALVGAHHILYVSRLRVNTYGTSQIKTYLNFEFVNVFFGKILKQVFQRIVYYLQKTYHLLKNEPGLVRQNKPHIDKWQSSENKCNKGC